MHNVMLVSAKRAFMTVSLMITGETETVELRAKQQPQGGFWNMICNMAWKRGGSNSWPLLWSQSKFFLPIATCSGRETPITTNMYLCNPKMCIIEIVLSVLAEIVGSG